MRFTYPDLNLFMTGRGFQGNRTLSDLRTEHVEVAKEGNTVQCQPSLNQVLPLLVLRHHIASI